MGWKLRVLAATSLALVSCRPDSVDLAYRFQEGQILTYRMTARAEAEWDVAGRGQGSYDVSFDVTETVRSVEDDGVTVVVEMIPLVDESREHGLPSPGLERRTFSLRLGTNGEVLEVLQLDGIEAGVLDHDELAFIGTYRPALPEGSARLGDEWSGENTIQLGTDFQEIQTQGTLEGFERSGSTELARIAFLGRSPLEWLSQLPQGEAQLSGEATTGGTALFDIAGGNLAEATSTTSGDFEVRVLPGHGAAPITGTLSLDLTLQVSRAS